MFKKNIAVVTVGYNKYAFQDAERAMDLIRILSEGVAVTDSMYNVRDYTDAEYALSDDCSLPELKFVAESKIDGQNTTKEIKERGDREKKDREDMEQSMEEAPTALPAPAPNPLDEILF